MYKLDYITISLLIVSVETQDPTKSLAHHAFFYHGARLMDIRCALPAQGACHTRNTYGDIYIRPRRKVVERSSSHKGPWTKCAPDLLGPKAECLSLACRIGNPRSDLEAWGPRRSRTVGGP
jgi:hypothetical protein